MDRRTFLTVALVAPALGQTTKKPTQKPAPKPAPVAAPPAVPWPQWGGPHRNFQTEASGLKDTWPVSGPRVVWKRPLGEGYSSPAVEGGVLYTMYGRPRVEVVLAANAETGTTLWEQSAPMTFNSDAGAEMGNGPYSTPLIVGDRLFTTGVAGRLQCLDRRTGKSLWTQQLWDEHGGSRLMYGYSSSPIAFRNTVIVPVGGRGKAIVAFNQTDGKVAWAKNDFGNVYSSPVLIDVDGLEQLAVLMDGVERPAGHELHRNEVDPIVLSDVVDGDDAGVIERRGSLRLLREATAAIDILSLRRWKDLDGDEAIQVGVARFVDDTHAPFTELVDDLEVAERATDHR